MSGRWSRTRHEIPSYDALVAAIDRVHRRAQAGAAGAVNRHLVLRNWLIGGYIVEFEQKGADRAQMMGWRRL